MNGDSKFLGILVPHSYPRDAANDDAVMVDDFAIRIPLTDMPWPDFMLEDCDEEARQDAFVEFIRPFIVRARDGANDDDASVGAFMNFRDGDAYLCFKQIYVGDVEYATLRELADSGDLERLTGNVREKLVELLRYFESCVFDAVRAAHTNPGGSHDWLPEPFRGFARFYDDASYADWSDRHWFAYDQTPEIVPWLNRQEFSARVVWHQHPCNGALVVAFESPDDAAVFQSTWGDT